MENKKNTSRKVGLPPGTLIHVGKRKAEKVEITMTRYNKDTYEETPLTGVAECAPRGDKELVKWLNIDGLHDTEVIQKVGDLCGLHPLLLEDLLDTKHRPKIEFYDDYIFITLKMMGYNADRTAINYEQVSLVLGEDYVLSFQEMRGDIFEDLRGRLREGKGKIRGKGAEYLAYRLMDVVVDHYFLITDNIGEQIEALEMETLKRTDDAVLKTIQKRKRELLFLRKTIQPLSEVLGSLEKESETDSAKYFTDVHDHTTHILDNLETYRDMLSSLLDTYHSSQSNKMNEVMKLLTIIATIFIPLTFIAGIYGMNFEYMPELRRQWGYPVVWIVMVAVAIMMLVYFRRKKWL